MMHENIIVIWWWCKGVKTQTPNPWCALHHVLARPNNATKPTERAPFIHYPPRKKPPSCVLFNYFITHYDGRISQAHPCTSPRGFWLKFPTVANHNSLNAFEHDWECEERERVSERPKGAMSTMPLLRRADMAAAAAGSWFLSSFNGNVSEQKYRRFLIETARATHISRCLAGSVAVSLSLSLSFHTMHVECSYTVLYIYIYMLVAAGAAAVALSVASFLFINANK